MANRGAWGMGLRLLAVATAAIAFVPVALWWLRLLGVIPDATPLAGIEFLPPSWLFAVVGPALLLLVLSRLHVAGALLAFLWFGVALFRGDHVIGSGSAPSTAGGADVGLLEWNVAGAKAADIAAGLGELRPDVAILAGADPALAGTLGKQLAPWRVLDGGPGGIALVTPHRVLAWRTVELPEEAHRRPVLHVELEIVGRRVHALAVNLDDRDRTPLRDRLARGGLVVAARDAGARFLTDYVGTLDGPVIVGGDLGAPPSTRAIRRIAAVADDLLLADHPVGLISLGTWEEPVRSDYLFVRDLDPVRSEQIEQSPAGPHPLFGVARLPPAVNGFAAPTRPPGPAEG